MANPSSIPSTTSQNSKTNNLKTLFAHGLNLQTMDHGLINNFILHWFNQYIAMNLENWSLWDSIQTDSAKFEAKHFDQLNNATWRGVSDYYYMYEFWIDHNFGPAELLLLLC